ncbi:MAG: hypothetical protein KDB79_03180 [Acidobacteria bacterium]|nr:hypothetical protein [Acidobacteriota bacterium]
MLLILLFHVVAAYSQGSLSQPDDKTLIITDAPEAEVFAFGKTVIVKKRTKGVLSFGGDVIIEGDVSGDVAAIGGSVIQKKDAFVGGDVIIFGGKYRPEAVHPRRNKDRETVMYAGYENELRELMQNPSQLFAPSFTWSFVLQRIFSILFWFVVSLALVTITPGAVGRAIARFQLSMLKVFGAGALVFIVTSVILMFSLEFLPSFLSVILCLMAFVLVMLAYVFGRVTLQASIGKWILKRVSPEKKPSDAFALIIGSTIWTILLSIPYLWTGALFALFIASLGLILTARSMDTWKESADFSGQTG